MTLLVTVFAAVACTVFWYASSRVRELKTGILCWMFWGASVMWLVDAVFEYGELGAAYFTPSPADMLNDLYLGLSVIALALLVWLCVLLIKDPRKVIRQELFGKTRR